MNSIINYFLDKGFEHLDVIIPYLIIVGLPYAFLKFLEPIASYAAKAPRTKQMKAITADNYLFILNLRKAIPFLLIPFSIMLFFALNGY